MARKHEQHEVGEIVTSSQRDRAGWVIAGLTAAGCMVLTFLLMQAWVAAQRAADGRASAEVAAASRALREREIPAAAGHLASALRAEPGNRAAAIAAWSLLAHHGLAVPGGPPVRALGGKISRLEPIGDGKGWVIVGPEILERWQPEITATPATRAFPGTAITALAVDSAGHRIVAGTSDGRMYFLDAETLADLRAPVELMASAVGSIGWAPGGDILAVVLKDRAGASGLCIIAADGGVRDRIEIDDVGDAAGEGVRVIWNGDGAEIAVGGGGRKYRLADWDGRKLEEAGGGEVPNRIVDLAFLADGTLRIVDAVEGWRDDEGPWHRVIGGQGKLSSGGTWFLSTSGRGIEIRRVIDGMRLSVPYFPGAPVEAGYFLGGERVALVSGDVVRTVVFREGPPMYPLLESGGDLLVTDRSGKFLAIGTRGSDLVTIWEIASLGLAARPIRFATGVADLAFDQETGTLRALLADGGVFDCDWRSALEFHERARIDVAGGANGVLSPDGRGLLEIADGSLRWTALPDGSVVAETKVDDEMTVIACQSVGHEMTVVAAGRGECVVWRMVAGSEATELLRVAAEDHGWDFRTAKLSPSGDRLAVADRRDAAAVVSFESEGETGFAEIGVEGAGELAWSADSECLLVAGSQDLVVWSVKANEVIARVQVASDVVTGLRSVAGAVPTIVVADSQVSRLVPWVPVAAAPRWIPELLDCVAGSAGSFEKERMRRLGGDSGERTSRWNQLGSWVFEVHPGRAAAVGIPIDEAAVAMRLAKHHASRERLARREAWRRRLEMEGARFQLELGELLDADLRDFPEDRGAILLRLELAAASRDLSRMGELLKFLAESPETTRREAVDAELRAAKAALLAPLPDRAFAEHMLTRVLVADPAQAEAAELLESVRKQRDR